MAKDQKDRKKRKWNTKTADRKNRTIKPLTPKSGEDRPGISREGFFGVLKQVNRQTKPQHTSKK